MSFKIITVARWFGDLSEKDVSSTYDDEHPYMAFDGANWNALQLDFPFRGMASLKKDIRSGKRQFIGTYLSEAAKSEILVNAPAIDVRNMR